MEKIIWFVKEHKAVRRVYRALGGALVRLIGLFVGIKDNQILFTSYNGKEYNDSPRKIFEYMQENYSASDFEYIWAFRDTNRSDIPDCTIVRSDSLKYLIAALSSKYWVTNVNIERGLKFKKKDTIYLNTYHGIAIKKDGKSAGHEYADYSNVDVLCADSLYLKNILINDYDANDSCILMCGRPREDELWAADSKSKTQAREILSIPDDKKVILYAPTWREYDMATVSPPIDFKKWEEVLSDEYVVIYRAHHYARTARIDTNSDFLIDGNAFDEINDEYIAADILISDYSGVFGDFSILERPMLCFGYDYDDYKHSRGFNIDPKMIFENVYRSEAELLKAIISIDIHKESSLSREFKKKYECFGGEATKTCVEEMLKKGRTIG